MAAIWVGERQSAERGVLTTNLLSSVYAKQTYWLPNHRHHHHSNFWKLREVLLKDLIRYFLNSHVQQADTHISPARDLNVEWKYGS